MFSAACLGWACVQCRVFVCTHVKLVSDSCREGSLDGTASWCTAVTRVLTALKEQEFDCI